MRTLKFNFHPLIDSGSRGKGATLGVRDFSMVDSEIAFLSACFATLHFLLCIPSYHYQVNTPTMSSPLIPSGTVGPSLPFARVSTAEGESGSHPSFFFFFLQPGSSRRPLSSAAGSTRFSRAIKALLVLLLIIAVIVVAVVPAVVVTQRNKHNNDLSGEGDSITITQNGHTTVVNTKTLQVSTQVSFFLFDCG